MALDDDVIKYSDIIQPDASLDILVNKLEEISKSYSVMVETIKAGTDKIAASLNSASGATKKGKEVISEAAEAANRLERAYRDLIIAESEEGKMIAQLKALTSDANKASVAELRALEAKAGSYDKLQRELKEHVALYKSLTTAEREDAAMGKELINQILDYKNQIKALDAELKPHIEQLSRVQKAEQELAFLRSEEGKRLLTLQKEIRAVKAAYNEQKIEVDPLVTAKEKLVFAQSAEYKNLQRLNFETKKQQRIAKLTAVINATQEDSYERLSAEYALGKIRLSQLNQAQIEHTKEGRDLVALLNQTYAKMRLLQESTGNYALGVGMYNRAFEGLNFSIAQVVRELPAAAVSLNTFFLGISNNIPMVVDEINKLRKAGTSGIGIIKGIGKAIFGWQTLLIIGLTAFSMYGEEIISWVGNLFKAKDAVLSFTDAQKALSEELKSTNANYGDSVVSLHKLAAEWQSLTTTTAMQAWIKDNKSEFDKLGISITTINDAELAFVTNTQDILQALDLRAQAAAATKLATEKYEAAFVKQKELEADIAKFQERGWGFGKVGEFNRRRAEIEGLKSEASAYLKLSSAANLASKAKINAAGLSAVDPLKTKKPKSSRTREGRDVSDMLNNEQRRAQKNYETSQTNLEREEFEKRRSAAKAAYDDKVTAAENANAKLERIFKDESNKYKDLTAEQKEQIQETIATNNRAIESYRAEYKQELQDIATDEEIFTVKHTIDALNLKLAAIKKGGEDEFNLRKQILEKQKQLALAENAKLPASKRQDANAIIADYDKRGRVMAGEYLTQVFDQQQELEAALFNTVERTEAEITKFRLTQEALRWTFLIDLARKGMLDWSDAQLEAANATFKQLQNQVTNLTKDNSFLGRVAEHGLLGALIVGFGNKEGWGADMIQGVLEGVDTLKQSVLSNLSAILDAEVEYAERMKEIADERVADAQRAYDAEVEGRNKGYANNVATAKKELEQEKRNQQQKQKLLEEAQRRQEALNSITQASSLITASAQLWQSFSGIPIVGPALAIAAIATMWGSFTAAKVKARQMTAISEEYGEGGLEFLEGGSHASGNDIDLGVNNQHNRRMRAEGGEALAIINKKNTRRYRRILPDVIDSFNKGTFEAKYLNAFGNLPNTYLLGTRSNTDLTRLESEVAKIRKQGETQYFLGPDGTIIELRGNVKRTIKS